MRYCGYLSAAAFSIATNTGDRCAADVQHVGGTPFLFAELIYRTFSHHIL
jgi:hypothetical protein